VAGDALTTLARLRSKGQKEFGLKDQPRLEFKNTARQRAAGLAEVGIVDGYVVRIACERNQVEFIEQVERVGTQFQPGILILKEWKRRRLHKAHVKRLVTWPTERVAMNKRRADRANVKVRLARDWTAGSIAIEAGIYSREVPIRLHQSGRAVIILRAAQVGGWQSGAQRPSCGNRWALIALDR